MVRCDIPHCSDPMCMSPYPGSPNYERAEAERNERVRKIELAWEKKEIEIQEMAKKVRQIKRDEKNNLTLNEKSIKTEILSGPQSIRDYSERDLTMKILMIGLELKADGYEQMERGILQKVGFLGMRSSVGYYAVVQYYTIKDENIISHA